MSLHFNGRWRGPVDLGTATMGTAWQTIGSSVRTGGAHWVGAFVDVTINDSTDVRFRMQGMYAENGSAYALPIATDYTDEVQVEDELAELNVDANQRQSLLWEMAGVYPYARLQASVGTAGGTAATLDDAKLVSAI